MSSPQGVGAIKNGVHKAIQAPSTELQARAAGGAATNATPNVKPAAA